MCIMYVGSISNEQVKRKQSGELLSNWNQIKIP